MKELEFKGTKGKWNIFDFNGKVSCIDIALDDKSGAIAQVYSPTEIGYKEEQTTEHKANAQLIATAPELLSELQHVVKALETVSSFGATRPIIDRAKKVIAKALGKEETR